MKENLAPAVMHMHEDTTVMNESVFKNGIITLYAVERKKRKTHQGTKQKAKEAFASSFYAYGNCHISM